MESVQCAPDEKETPGALYTLGTQFQRISLAAPNNHKSWSFAINLKCKQAFPQRTFHPAQRRLSTQKQNAAQNQAGKLFQNSFSLITRVQKVPTMLEKERQCIQTTYNNYIAALHPLGPRRTMIIV